MLIREIFDTKVEEKIDPVVKVAERPVKCFQAVGHAGIDHAGDGVVPQVLLKK